MADSRVVLLGPQRLQPILIQTVDDLGLDGPLAAITAGWEERESEDQELSLHLRGRSRNLRLWERTEELYQRDPALHAAVRKRIDASLRMRELYRLRLDHGLEATRAILAKSWPDEWGALVRDEVRESIESLRRLDREHQERMQALQREFDHNMRPLERSSVQRTRQELELELQDCPAVCIAGGNVRVLLHRMRLLDLPALWKGRAIIAWSAGAMALAQRVVLFHDRPPQGMGNTEVMDAGLGAYPGLVPFPHAEKRLLLDDETRLFILAQRMSPDLCVLLTPLARADWDGSRWDVRPPTSSLTSEGRIQETRAA